MILKAQNIKPGMMIYLPRMKETIIVEKVMVFGDSYDFVCKHNGFALANHGASVPVVGFSII
jgi:hypothetical protein